VDSIFNIKDRKPNIMNTTWNRRILAGLAGGLAFGVVNFFTFGLLSGSRVGQTGLLFDPSTQSAKVIAVWKEILPLPWLVTQPWVIMIGLLLFGVVYAFAYFSVEKAWPPQSQAHIWRLTALTFVAPAFFELMGPFNLLHEPLQLQLIEFVFWIVASLAQSMVIVKILRRARVAQQHSTDSSGINIGTG
jgi:hypothetical protein